MQKSCIVAVSLFALLGTSPAGAYRPTDLGHLHDGASTRAPIGWTQFCSSYPADCVTSPSTATAVALTPARWHELDGVNRHFNKAIEPVTDVNQYGVVERWTYATTGKGDCEDYVLEKRRRLAQLGWPLSALLVTVVIDKENSGHAVLTVVTDRGEFVLDNVVDDIVAWSHSRLTFVKRQSPADPNVWVDLGRTLGSHELITATSGR